MKTIQESWPEINLKPEHRYDIPANPQQWSVKTIGDVPWTTEAQLDSLEEFLEIYAERPVKSNDGGVLAPHAFGLWFIAKHITGHKYKKAGKHISSHRKCTPVGGAH